MANANIFAQYLRAPRSVADYSADLDKQEAADLQLSQARQARADDNALRQAARSFGADADANYRTLLQAGLPTQAMAYRKGAIENDAKRAEIAKNTAQTGNFASETSARDFETKLKKANQAISDIVSYSSPQQALAQLQAHVQAGEIDPQKATAIGQQLQAIGNDAGAFSRWQVGMLRGMMSAKDALESQKLHFQTNNLGGQTVTQGLDPITGAQVSQVSQQNTQSPDNAATQATAMRGQNMADARAREVVAQGRVPAGYRQKPDGTLEFIPGGPADPASAKRAAPTEFQGKSATYAARADDADRTITELAGKYSPAAINAKQAAGKVWWVGGALEAGASAALSADAQRAEQAQRTFINAVLRQESGAAISESEFDNARRQYFPQPGDGKDVIAQKAKARRLAVEGLRDNAGNARIPTATGGASGSFDAAPAAPSGGGHVLRFDANGNMVR